MMYPKELGEMLDVSQFFFAQIVGLPCDNLQKVNSSFTIKSQKAQRKKGRKQAVFGGNDHGVTFTGSPHISTRE